MHEVVTHSRASRRVANALPDDTGCALFRSSAIHTEFFTGFFQTESEFFTFVTLHAGLGEAGDYATLVMG